MSGDSWFIVDHQPTRNCHSLTKLSSSKSVFDDFSFLGNYFLFPFSFSLIEFRTLEPTEKQDSLTTFSLHPVFPRVSFSPPLLSLCCGG